MVKERVLLRTQALSLPNLITYIRILAIPVVLGVMLGEGRGRAFLAAVVFGLAALTDALDGYLARRLNQVSVIGQLIDPLADKLIVMATLVTLVQLGRVSAWPVVLILAREMYVTGLRSVAASQGLVLAARPLAKQKTALQMMAIGCLLIHFRYELLGVPVDFNTLGFGLLILSIVFSLASAFDYTRSFARVVDGQDP